MMSSSDNFYEMLHAQPEENAAPEPPPPAADPAAALVAVAEALYHWQPVARNLEATLNAAGNSEAAAHLRITRERIAEALKVGGVEVDDPLGKSFSQVVDRVSVIGWRQQPGVAGEIVCQVIQTVIYCNRVLAQRGKVIMASAPPAAAIPPPTPS